MKLEKLSKERIEYASQEINLFLPSGLKYCYGNSILGRASIYVSKSSLPLFSSHSTEKGREDDIFTRMFLRLPYIYGGVLRDHLEFINRRISLGNRHHNTQLRDFPKHYAGDLKILIAKGVVEMEDLWI